MPNTETIIYIIVFVYIIVFTLIVPGTLLKEFLIRPFRIKKLAQKYKLNYTYRTGWGFFDLNNIKKNIIEGNIGSHSVKFYDTSRYSPYAGYTTDVPPKIVSGSQRQTHGIIDGKSRVYTSFVSGYFPVSKLDALLSKLSQE